MFCNYNIWRFQYFLKMFDFERCLIKRLRLESLQGLAYYIIVYVYFKYVLLAA